MNWEPLGLFLVSVGAGAFGAMLGLGGGIILVPAMTLLFHVELTAAIAASLVSIVATSCVGVQTYLRAGLTNVNLGARLLIPMVLGAILGGVLGTRISEKMVAALFIILIFYVLFQMIRAAKPAKESVASTPAPSSSEIPYHKRPIVYGVSILSGIISALLGVGGGLIQVPLINGTLGYPLRAAIGTSGFLIGATAAISALIYLAEGAIIPDLVVPCVLGVMVGAKIGAVMGMRVPTRALRFIFAGVMIYTAIRMYLKWFL